MNFAGHFKQVVVTNRWSLIQVRLHRYFPVWCWWLYSIAPSIDHASRCYLQPCKTSPESPMAALTWSSSHHPSIGISSPACSLQVLLLPVIKVVSQSTIIVIIIIISHPVMYWWLSASSVLLPLPSPYHHSNILHQCEIKVLSPYQGSGMEETTQGFWSGPLLSLLPSTHTIDHQ